MKRFARPVVLALLCLLAFGAAASAAADTWVAWGRTGLLSEPRIRQGAGWVLAGDKGDPENFPTQTACVMWAHQYMKELVMRGVPIERTRTGWRALNAVAGRTGAEPLLMEVGCFPSSLRPPR